MIKQSRHIRWLPPITTQTPTIGVPQYVQVGMQVMTAHR